jgi:RNA recognition motif-containing protein
VVLSAGIWSNLSLGMSKKWKDKALSDWPENDYRMFVGNLGSDVTDDVLASGFRNFKSFQKAKVIRDKRTLKSKGFGFISFLDGSDMLLALREMNGKYIGSRPCLLKRAKLDD